VAVLHPDGRTGGTVPRHCLLSVPLRQPGRGIRPVRRPVRRSEGVWM